MRNKQERNKKLDLLTLHLQDISFYKAASVSMNPFECVVLLVCLYLVFIIRCDVNNATMF